MVHPFTWPVSCAGIVLLLGNDASRHPWRSCSQSSARERLPHWHQPVSCMVVCSRCCGCIRFSLLVGRMVCLCASLSVWWYVTCHVRLSQTARKNGIRTNSFDVQLNLKSQPREKLCHNFLVSLIEKRILSFMIWLPCVNNVLSRCPICACASFLSRSVNSSHR